MNVSENKYELDEKEAQVIENMEFDVDGSRLRTRRGMGTALYTFEADVLYIWNDYELNLFLVFLKNKNIYRYEYGKTPTLIGQLNGDVTKHPSVARFGTKILIASGSTLQIYEYSGTTINTDTTYPQCDTVMERFSRVVVSKLGSNDIKYSGIGDPTNWTANSNDPSSSKDIEVGDIAGISGLYPLSTDLIVFKDNGMIYKVSNEPEDWNISLVGNNSDFLSRTAMTNLGEDVVYLSRQGLRSESTSETYGNFTNEEVGEKCNPILRKSYTNPYIEKLDRTNQLIVSTDSGNTLYAYHYALKAFTKWTFPVAISSLSEGKEVTLISAGKDIFNFSWNNYTDVVSGTVHPIHQTILSKMVGDVNIMTLYRSHLLIESDSNGTATMTVNGISWTWNWTKDKPREEFKTQIRSSDMDFKFETDNVIKWQSWIATIVRQYVAFTSTNGNDKSSGNSWTKTKWGQGTFAGTVGSSGGSPYGYV